MTARRKQIWGALHPVEQLVPPARNEDGTFGEGQQGFAAATAAVTAANIERAPAGAGHRKTYRKLSDRAAHCILVQCSGTVTPKAKAPVCEDTSSEAVAAPTEKRGFVMSKFWGLVRLHLSRMVYGRGGGYPQGRPHDFGRVFNHHAHPMRVKTQTVALVTPEGAKTMTVSTQASRRAAPILPTTGNTHHHDPIQLDIAARNACAMASYYTRKGNHAGAARKAAQALSALRKLAAFERLEVTA